MYHYKCKKCGKVFDEFAKIKDRHKVKCECGGDAIIWFGGIKSVALHVWKPYWEENITHHPVYVESKQHLKELCKKYDCVAHRLD